MASQITQTNILPIPIEGGGTAGLNLPATPGTAASVHGFGVVMAEQAEAAASTNSTAAAGQGVSVPPAALPQEGKPLPPEQEVALSELQPDEEAAPVAPVLLPVSISSAGQLPTTDAALEQNAGNEQPVQSPLLRMPAPQVTETTLVTAGATDATELAPQTDKPLSPVSRQPHIQPQQPDSQALEKAERAETRQPDLTAAVRSVQQTAVEDNGLKPQLVNAAQGAHTSLKENSAIAHQPQDAVKLRPEEQSGAALTQRAEAAEANTISQFLTRTEQRVLETPRQLLTTTVPTTDQKTPVVQVQQGVTSSSYLAQVLAQAQASLPAGQTAASIMPEGAAAAAQRMTTAGFFATDVDTSVDTSGARLTLSQLASIVNAGSEATTGGSESLPKVLQSGADLVRSVSQAAAVALSAPLNNQAEEAVEATQNSEKSSYTTLGASHQPSLSRPVADVQMRVPTGMTPAHNGWSQAVSERIVWAAGQQVQSATIQLDPPELGSLQVKLQISHEQVSLTFTSPHGNVREALEQSLPRLREMMAEQGLSLGESFVQDQPQSGRGEGDAEQEQGTQRFADGEQSEQQGEDSSQTTSAQTARRLSLVDDYA